MSVMNDAVYGALRHLGFNRLLRYRRTGAVVLCYHNVIAHATGQGDPGLHLASDAFRSQMRWLASRFDVVPLRTLIDRARRAHSLRGVATVTFDDGYRGVRDHALPILQELGLPATIFVTVDGSATGRPFWWDHPAFAATVASDVDERSRLLEAERGDRDAILAARGLRDAALPSDFLPMSWADLRRLGTGVSIGAHSVTHRNMTRLDDAALARELTDSAATIERELGTRPTEFAYPYGRWDSRVRAATERAGYSAAVTLGEFDVHADSDPFGIPRINIPASLGHSAFEAWTSGLSDLRARRGARSECAVG